ncbi:unnamed protein product [Rhodiola kirilowii]
MAAKLVANGETDQVLVEKKGFGRVLVMNRPRKLNAISFEMVSRMLELFLYYERDSEVKFVIVKVKGRAFCAGGDVSAVVRLIHEGKWKHGAVHFATEYTLNYILATFSKPQISILDGIVMGGGAGISVYGKFRIATENSLFAMPETALGLFPDVGASFFLSRLPGFFGEYLGLTGARLDDPEMLACGLATHYVPSHNLSLLEEKLITVDSSDAAAAISEIINKYSEQPLVKQQSAFLRLETIDKCFSRRTVEEIVSALLELEAANKSDEFINTTLQTLKKASPTSLKISLRSIRRGRLEGIGKCLSREYRMVCHVMLGHVSNDFLEGCRAILIDKDRNPKWAPSKLELVSDDMVEKYFTKVPELKWEDLNLPARPQIPSYSISKL